MYGLGERRRREKRRERKAWVVFKVCDDRWSSCFRGSMIEPAHQSHAYTIKTSGVPH